MEDRFLMGNRIVLVGEEIMTRLKRIGQFLRHLDETSIKFAQFFFRSWLLFLYPVLHTITATPVILHSRVDLAAAVNSTWHAPTRAMMSRQKTKSEKKNKKKKKKMRVRSWNVVKIPRKMERVSINNSRIFKMYTLLELQNVGLRYNKNSQKYYE